MVLRTTAPEHVLTHIKTETTCAHKRRNELKIIGPRFTMLSMTNNHILKYIKLEPYV